MATRESVASFKGMYGAVIPPTWVPKATNAAIGRVAGWQPRPLDATYPVVYPDCTAVKTRQDKQVANKSTYLAPGANPEGHKELPGMWLPGNEGAKCWLGVPTERQGRGLQSILVACVDGPKGFPDAIQTVYPKARVQLCTIHRVRNPLRYVAWKGYKAVATAPKRTCQPVAEEEALQALGQFAESRDGKYPQTSRSWQGCWPNPNTLSNYPEDIRKAVYTTNAVGPLNSVVRKVIKKRKLFPSDGAARKVPFLAIGEAPLKWTMPIRNWRPAMGRFMIGFEGQLKGFV